jgi:hypothetical protein
MWTVCSGSSGLVDAYIEPVLLDVTWRGALVLKNLNSLKLFMAYTTCMLYMGVRDRLFCFFV